jgi:hypothetical protein
MGCGAASAYVAAMTDRQGLARSSPVARLVENAYPAPE